ncbi:MAG: alpha-ketoglutarate-dependent dioxygenase AlkB [Candidatus Sulfotelmatobacter sp.]|jgi:DNA oxidative demethylase
MAAKRHSDPAEWPEGFLYRAEFLSETEEAELLRAVKTLEFGVYDFRGYIARRRVMAFGGGYEPGAQRVQISSNVIPESLASIREGAAGVAGISADEIAQAMVTEYPVGAPIGWHRDAPQFGIIIGISIGGACRMRLKPYRAEGKIISVLLEPRSIYVMSGAARSGFQHSIPAVKELRYSITFRTLREKGKAHAA